MPLPTQDPRARRPIARGAAVAVAALVVPLALGSAPAGAASYPAAAPVGPAVAAKPRIVGGSPITIGQAPWQAYLTIDDDANPSNGYYECGGTIIDPTHVLTAAHCTFDPETNVATPASGFTVTVGVSRSDGLPVPGDTRQVRAVSQVRRHPYYVSLASGAPQDDDTFADDAAVLTLSAPLASTASVQAVALPAPGGGPPEGASLSITGYGLQSEGGAEPDGGLYRVGETVADPAWAGTANALWLVGVGATGSSCQGDSGGPVVTGSPATLVGLVSNGVRCGANEQDRLTNVAAPEILSFVTGSATPPRAPRGGGDVTMSAPRTPIRVGDTLTCHPGSWSSAPSFGFAFVDVRSGTVLQDGPSATYPTAAGDVGRTVSCRATASNAGGVGRTPPTRPAPPIVAAAVRTPPAPQAPAPPAPSPTPPTGPRLSATLTATPKRVAAGRRIGFRLTVRNAGATAATGVRSCVALPRRVTAVARGGGRLTQRRLCWTTPTVTGSITKRFVLRVDRRARPGRVRLTLAVTSATGASAAAGRTIDVVRR